jgi:hypothetical protein
VWHVVHAVDEQIGSGDGRRIAWEEISDCRYCSHMIVKGGDM